MKALVKIQDAYRSRRRLVKLQFKKKEEPKKEKKKKRQRERVWPVTTSEQIKNIVKKEVTIQEEASMKRFERTKGRENVLPPTSSFMFISSKNKLQIEQLECMRLILGVRSISSSGSSSRSNCFKQSKPPSKRWPRKKPQQSFKWCLLESLLLATTLSCLLVLNPRLSDGVGKGTVSGLKLNSVQVPAAVMNSTSQVMLVCDFDLQGDQLYSVQWYKNWNEFYTYQPMATNDQTTTVASFSSSQSMEPSSADNNNERLWKHDHALTGINLNLAKSNATHVYLRSISLQSEGTYKCEVTGSRSFATVSLEREMKVYVLPKQKLTIIDNNNNYNQQLQSSSGAADISLPQSNSLFRQLQQQPINALIYNVNDFINLTCLSGASKPPAKLQWFINDKPVPSTSKMLSWRSALNSTSSGSSGQVTSSISNRHHRQQQDSTQQQLAESRLTLTFRLQPNHLSEYVVGSTTAVNIGTGTGTGHHDHMTTSRRISSSGGSIHNQVMRIRCTAKISLDYSYESSLPILGSARSSASASASSSGSSGNSRRRQQQHSAHALQPLPTPESSVISRTDESTTLEHSANHNHFNQQQHYRNNNLNKTTNHQSMDKVNNYPIYRWPRPSNKSGLGWPRPLGGGGRRGQGGGGSPLPAGASETTTTNPNYTDQPPSSQENTMINNQSPFVREGGGSSRSSAGGRRPAGSSFGFGPKSIWTSGQLREQADFIDQLVRISRPNDFEKPLIVEESRMTQQTSSGLFKSKTLSSTTSSGELDTAAGDRSPDGASGESSTNDDEEEVMKSENAPTDDDGDGERKDDGGSISDYDTTTITSTLDTEEIITTTTMPFWDHSSQAPPDGAAVVHITRTSSSSYSSGSNGDDNQSNNDSNDAKAQQSAATTTTTKDYELNDIGQFVCAANQATWSTGSAAAAAGVSETGRSSFDNQAAATVNAASIKSTKQVHLKWFINDQEINATLINAYDGSKFHYAQQVAKLNGKQTTTTKRVHPQPTTTTISSSNNHSGTSSQHQSQDYELTVPDLETQETSQQQSAAAAAARLLSSGSQEPLTGSSKLLIEFSQNLFQLKELNLRCRSVVEQPLIEFESQLLISIPQSSSSSSSSNHHQFVQVSNSNTDTIDNNNNFHPSQTQQTTRLLAGSSAAKSNLRGQQQRNSLLMTSGGSNNQGSGRNRNRNGIPNSATTAIGCCSSLASFVKTLVLAHIISVYLLVVVV